jgi:hypothetical protein
MSLEDSDARRLTFLLDHGVPRSATSILLTLSVSNGRNAIWSGACSSGENKTKTCTVTITGNTSVTENVQ